MYSSTHLGIPSLFTRMWPFKRGGHLSEIEINVFMLRIMLSSLSGLFKGADILSGWLLNRGSTVYSFSKQN